MAGFVNSVRKLQVNPKTQTLLDRCTITIHSTNNVKLGTLLANYPLTPQFAVLTA
jgi:hypothetical protein